MPDSICVPSGPFNHPDLFLLFAGGLVFQSLLDFFSNLAYFSLYIFVNSVEIYFGAFTSFLFFLRKTTYLFFLLFFHIFLLLFK